MKILYLIFLVPLVLLAQTDKMEYLEMNADWKVPSEIGTVIEIKGDSINFEEAWMHIISNRTVIMDKSGASISLEHLRAPCKVEISFFGKGKNKYVTSIRLLKQLEQTADGYIIDDETSNE